MFRPTKVEFSRSALRANIKRIRALAPGCACYPAVKANAYGHGLAEVGLLLQSQVEGFSVASLDEAIVLRSSGVPTPIVILNGVFSIEEMNCAAHHDCQWVLHSRYQLQLLEKISSTQKIWLKVNTGMNRLGFLPEKVPKIIMQLRQMPWIEVSHIMTHLACADEVDSWVHNQQKIRWQKMLETLGPLYSQRLSVANSAALWGDSWADIQSVRPGIALYGCSPFQNQVANSLGLVPVSRFYTQVIAVQEVDPGETIGYGGTFKAEAPMKIGILAVGYGDGYPRHAPSGTPVLISGKQCSLVGRVSMDMLTVDLTHLPQAIPGMLAELWGLNLPVEHIAYHAETIGYELYCQLSHRVDRCWID